MNGEFEFEAFDEQPFFFETEEEDESSRRGRMPSRRFVPGRRSGGRNKTFFRRPVIGQRFDPRFPVRFPSRPVRPPVWPGLFTPTYLIPDEPYLVDPSDAPQNPPDSTSAPDAVEGAPPGVESAGPEGPSGPSDSADNSSEFYLEFESNGPSSSSSTTFVPAPVENPGGGRIKNKQPPDRAEVVSVRGVGQRQIPLHRLAATALQALIDAARADGLAEPLLRPVSGFRDPARQAQLWQRALAKYGSPQEARKWVAPPGGSAHQSGRAIDFYLGGRNASNNVAQLRTLPAYRWLVTNARRFGFYPYEREPWHWEYNPPVAANRQRQSEAFKVEGGIEGKKQPTAAGSAQGAPQGSFGTLTSNAFGRQFSYFEPAEMPFELESDQCLNCGLSRKESEFDFGGNSELSDILINPRSQPGSYGKPSSFRNPTTTTERCTGGVARTCPTLPGLEEVAQVSGIGFEYIGGWSDKNNTQHHGIMKTGSGKWAVVEQNRLRNRVHKMLPRASDGLATFIANMTSVSLPIEAILTMGSVYCRCISNTTILSNHSYGDAIDIGGLRFVGGREVLVANSGDAADRRLLHRVNACLRLSFATVLDYHDPTRHWDHFHCDTNILNGGERRWDVAWPFVRESLGLSPKGGWDKPTANSLRQFAGVDAVKDKPTLNRTLSKLFMREATAQRDVSAPAAPIKPAGAPAPQPSPGNITRKGCKQDLCGPAYTRWVQQSLNRLLGLRLNENGYTDRNTIDAIRSFQAKKGLKPDASVGPITRQALLAAGASQPPQPKDLPCGPSSGPELARLINKYRGDIPFHFLLGWNEVESGRRIDSSTYLCERGYFQIHPAQSKDRGWDHEPLSFDPDYSIMRGVQLVREMVQATEKLAAKYGVPKGSDAFWGLVKMFHWIPSAPAKILDHMSSRGRRPSSWAAIMNYLVNEKTRIPALGNWDPIDGAKNAQKTLDKAEEWKTLINQ